ncbi:MAG: hypothetical protein IJN34_07110, partial [Clostridia bacterium]|nr:hypothetical protein [Clostridia bacterium]
MKKIIAFFLAAILTLSLTACNNNAYKSPEEGTIYYFGTTDNGVFKSPENKLDLDKIYDSLQYTEEMFYGRYWLNNFDEEIETFSQSAEFADLEYWGIRELQTKSLSTLPVKVEAGAADLYGKKIMVDRNYHWAYLTFAKADASYIDILCSFTVEGNKIRFTPVDYYEEILDENYKVTGVKYKTGEDALEYTFSLKGPSLTLSNGESSVTLRSFFFSENSTILSLGGYRAQNSAAIGNIDSFSSSETAVYLRNTNGELMFHPTLKPAVKYAENGVLTLFWAEKDENDNDITHTHQFLCFGSGYSMVLVDNDNIYNYTESYFSRE